MSNFIVAERALGGLFGLAVGDAVGVPYEFHSPERLPFVDDIDLVPPIEFNRSYRDIPPGTWSDDTALALCLLDSLLTYQKFAPEKFAQNMLSWKHDGVFAVDGVVFDIGIQTSVALRRFENGLLAQECGGDDSMANGNGALMRVLPLALWAYPTDLTDAEVIDLAHRQSRITHGHAISQVCCAYYTLVAKNALSGLNMEDSWDLAATTLGAIYSTSEYDNREQRSVWFNEVWPLEDKLNSGTGYVLDTLWSAKQVTLSSTNYKTIIQNAIALGNDTDTTACVAGGIAGIVYRETIPDQWLSQLRGGEILDDFAGRLTDHYVNLT